MPAQATFAIGNKRTIDKLIQMRKEAHHDRQPRVALRIQAILLSLKKHSPLEISAMLQVHRTRVHAWVKNWNLYGKEGILEGHRSGRPTRLEDKDKEHLYDIVDSGPIAYGYSSGVWTSPMVAQVIEEEFGINYHPGHVRKLLKQLGFSVQRPAKELANADPEKKNKWVRYTNPNLKKRQRRRCADCS